MSLSKDYIYLGYYFFKYRIYIQLIFLIPLIVYVYIYPELFFNNNRKWIFICLFISFIGQMIRILTIAYTPLGTSGRNTKKQVACSLSTSPYGCK